MVVLGDSLGGTVPMSGVGIIGKEIETVVGVLLPNRCTVCGDVLEHGFCVCDRCAEYIEVIYPPFCSRCGAPRGGGAPARRGAPRGGGAPARRGAPRGGGAPAGCGQCAGFCYEFSKNESLGVYTGLLRELIGLLKFEKRKGLSKTFASLFLHHKRGYIEMHDVIVAVPLTPQRRAARGFNQASLIAGRLAGGSTTVFVPRCIKRRGSSRPQSSIQGTRQRLSNLRDGFEVRPGCKEAIENRSVLLVDDVLTTGATASACALALKKAGAARVDMLSCARTVKSSGTVSLLLAKTGR